ncbi:MAG TPA: class I SAM-dependent methyltransferase [Acidimicrobiales bacterium]|nr:class I SAM-dependent methyltransferase [Acidimicrobiales bacterium]
MFRGFRSEQEDPTAFYQLLADDTIREVSRYCQLSGARVIDIGGASGYVGDALAEAGASSLTVEYERSQILEHGRRLKNGVQGDGMALPVSDAAFDVAYSSNVIEHVPDPEKMLQEMARVVTPGGIVFVTYTNWLSPWGGHETSPWHYFGGQRAVRRYEKRHGKPPKNLYGVSLFNLPISRVLKWARSWPDVEVLDAFPRYYPHWTWPLVRIPGLREVATWNLALVLRRRADAPYRSLHTLTGTPQVVLSAPTDVLSITTR